jgi:hypothetical protein
MCIGAMPRESMIASEDPERDGMSDNQDDRRPIKPPEKNHPDDKVRTVIEAAIGVVPGGGSIAKLAGDLIPTRAQKARGAWEGAISERTNEHSERLDQHAQALAPTTALSGPSSDLTNYFWDRTSLTRFRHPVGPSLVSPCNSCIRRS